MVLRMGTEKKRRGCFWTVLKWAFGLLFIVLLLAVIAICIRYHDALYNRFVLFPKQAAAWKAIQSERREVPLDDGWTEYRGVMHAHSELSHDSAVTFPEILAVLHKADCNFIFMTDHVNEGKADYSKGWKGLHDGVLFVRGYEMEGGFMPWGLPDNTILDNKEDLRALAKRIAGLGGVLFFAHCEEPRLWDLPELTGMEIYNIHVDFKDEDFNALLPSVIFSLWSYPDQAFRLMFDRPTEFLKKWDEMNITRHLTGIAANDAHQNVGIRVFYDPNNDTLRLVGTGEKEGESRRIRLNFFTRPLVRLVLGPLAPDKELYRVELDPYQRSARYVNTHLLATECTEPALLDALRRGRAFVGFDMLADARGFVFLAQGREKRAVMGESIPIEPDLTLRMASPHTCRFTILRQGVQVAQLTGNAFDWKVPEPGKYRVEAELQILGEWTPWVYANPIEVTAGTG